MIYRIMAHALNPGKHNLLGGNLISVTCMNCILSNCLSFFFLVKNEVYFSAKMANKDTTLAKTPCKKFQLFENH